MTQTVITLMTEEKEKIVALRAFVPESLRNDFKSVCAKEGKNMSDVLTEFIESYVKERSPASGTIGGKGRGKKGGKEGNSP
jgi:hypothetical protein